MDAPNQKLAIGRLLNIFGPWFGLVLVVGLFSLSNEVRPYFLTGANFKIILTQTVIVAIGSVADSEVDSSSPPPHEGCRAERSATASGAEDRVSQAIAREDGPAGARPSTRAGAQRRKAKYR